MKKQLSFLCMLWCVVSYVPFTQAANYRYQIESIGTSQYVIRLDSDVSQPFGSMMEGLKQKAQEVCQGQYQILQIDPATTKNIIGLIECLGSTNMTPSLNRQNTPIRHQNISPKESTQEYHVQNEAYRNRNEFSFARRFGIGYLANITNLTFLGPTLEYWLSDNIGLSSKIGISINFIEYFYSLRGNVIIGNPIVIGGPTARLYAGGGYFHIGTFDDSLDGDDGAEVYGGIMVHSNIIEKLYFRGEFGAFVMDFSDDYDFKFINVGVGVTYLF